ncbi:hypothetical protein CLU83_2272 [Flavobacterium sp. 1]|nr:hypothetical protein CLU83_2272 [Flavobacterium sp. 1]
MFPFSPDRSDILFIFPLKIKRFSEEQEPYNQKWLVFLLQKIMTELKDLEFLNSSAKINYVSFVIL